MADPSAASSSSTEGLPIAPSMGLALASVGAPRRATTIDKRVVFLTAIAIGLGLASGLVAQILLRLIGLITNIAFYATLRAEFVSPAQNHLGPWVVVVPVAGGLIVGLMARFGSSAIRGHGIPEVMERVLTGQSQIPPRLTFLKPLSAAIAIGTGGPFGAEGPIIATGGALGSMIGQMLETTADERKILLSAGAAAGMSATFGSPVSAVLLAIELLLFEFRPRSMIPVVFASASAAALRLAIVGSTPIFLMPKLAWPNGLSLALYCALGALIGAAAVVVTRAVYAIEDGFERLPIHWMWWPALGGLAVGIVGYFSPATLGVGYDNITHLLSGDLTAQALFVLCVLKFVSWSISLGSGTSGGTLAPLFTIGGALGAALGVLAAGIAPGLGLDPRLAGLVGMAAMFAGASRALLASVVFAYETTLQPAALLPLMTGCGAAFMVSSLLMRYTIMTEKVARRGVHVPTDYEADALSMIRVRDAATFKVVPLKSGSTVAELRSWIAEGHPGSGHQGFPVLSESGDLLGVVTRRDIYAPETGTGSIGALIKRPLAAVYADTTLREASDLMVRDGIGRLPVVSRENPLRVIGIISRSDIMAAQSRRLSEASDARRLITWLRRGSSEAARKGSTHQAGSAPSSRRCSGRRRA